MQYIGYSKPKLLIADEGYMLREKNDVYKPEHFDIETGNIIPEHFPYYSSLIFLAETINSLDKCKELYVEEKQEIESSVKIKES